MLCRANDLSYVTATLVDSAGIPVHQSRPNVTFRVTAGPGKVIAVGSGDPADPSSMRVAYRKIWRGRAVAVVQPTAGRCEGSSPWGGNSSITVTASVDGIPTATTSIVLVLKK